MMFQSMWRIKLKTYENFSPPLPLTVKIAALARNPVPTANWDRVLL
jgi:hypothetical protein